MAIIYNPMNDVTPALSNIAEAVSRAINPFHDLQMTVRNRAATDPTFAQKLSDLNSATPGLLDTLGLGPVGKAIAKIPPSAAQIIENQTRPAILAAAKNPQNQQIAASKAVTGLLPSGQAKEEAAQTAIANPQTAQIAGTKDVTGMTPSEIMKENLEAGNIQGAQQYFASNPSATVSDVAGGLLSGKLSLADATNLFSIPGTGKAISEAVNAQMKMADIQATGRLRYDLRADGIQEQFEKIRLAGAMTAWRNNGGAGTPTSYYQYMWGGPDVQKHAMDLLANPSSAQTQDDKNLIQTVQAVQGSSMSKKLQQIDAASDKVRVAVEHINNDAKKMDPDAITATLEGLQQHLDVKAEFGGQHLIAHYGKVPGNAGFFHPFGGNDQLYFTNEGGKVVSPDMATSSTIDPKIAGVVNTAFKKYIQTPPDQRANFFNSSLDSATVSQLKAIGTTPDEIKRLVLLRAGGLNPAIPVNTDTSEQP